MELRKAIGMALQGARESLGIAQEELPVSQSYLSGLEGGRRMPSLEKIDELAKAMGLSPLTLLAMTYQIMSGESPKQLIKVVQDDLKKLAVLK